MAYSFSLTAAPHDVAQVKIGADVNIRNISATYLNNPDLWIDILKANGLNSPHELKPGMTIQIPVGLILKVESELSQLNEKIQAATRAGARLFAPELINQATLGKDEAMLMRKAGNWDACLALFAEAHRHAEKALEMSLANHQVSAEAMISYAQGEVHKKQPSANVWMPINQNDILIEGERVRTLSRSNADILFRDDSRLHLKENSQALIRKMRVNLLEKTEEASVSLIEGDVLALLAGGGGSQQKINLDVVGVETRFNSNSFFVSQSREASRFANYEGEIEIQSAGVKVVLKKNQGSVVPANEQPSEPHDLLPEPQLTAPDNGAQFYYHNVTFTWNPVHGAIEYLLEFSLNAAFTKITDSLALKTPSATFPAHLPNGSFFWRVRAVSNQKLPGRHSQIRFFRIIQDETPPYLIVHAPQDGEIVNTENITISGVTEKDAALDIQEESIRISPDGEFLHALIIPEGESVIHISAADPAGNHTRITRKVTFMPQQEVALQYHQDLLRSGPRHFLTTQRRVGTDSRFNLGGITEPLATVSVKSQQSGFNAATTADESGVFNISLTLGALVEAFEVAARSRSGKTRQEIITVEVDDEPPVIVFEPTLPEAVASARLTISGEVKGGVSLLVNRQAWPLTEGGKFAGEVSLRPGKNVLAFKAEDLVGNMALVEKQVVLDDQPPELVDYSISPAVVAGGETLSIKVTATDATALVKAVPYRIAIGGFTFSGHLSLSQATSRYQGAFHVPKTVSGKVILKSVTLSDYLGNRREYAVSAKP